MYGALQAMQKYVPNLVGGEEDKDGVSIGQLCVSITDAAYIWLASCLYSTISPAFSKG
jgi:hypothetical protein